MTSAAPSQERWTVEVPALAYLAETAPTTYAAMATMYEQAYAVLDPELLELCSLRIFGMLDAHGRRDSVLVSPERAAALSAWSTSSLFTELERSCLALAEQFTFSVAYVDDALIADVLAHLSPAEVYSLVSALYVFDACTRLDLVVGGLFGADRS
jgi:hypothetical protein